MFSYRLALACLSLALPIFAISGLGMALAFEFGVFLMGFGRL